MSSAVTVFSGAEVIAVLNGACANEYPSFHGTERVSCQLAQLQRVFDARLSSTRALPPYARASKILYRGIIGAPALLCPSCECLPLAAFVCQVLSRLYSAILAHAHHTWVLQVIESQYHTQLVSLSML